jgi:hypothetical protein
MYPMFWVIKPIAARKRPMRTNRLKVSLNIIRPSLCRRRYEDYDRSIAEYISKPTGDPHAFIYQYAAILRPMFICMSIICEDKGAEEYIWGMDGHAGT